MRDATMTRERRDGEDLVSEVEELELVTVSQSKIRYIRIPDDIEPFGRIKRYVGSVERGFQTRRLPGAREPLMPGHIDVWHP